MRLLGPSAPCQAHTFGRNMPAGRREYAMPPVLAAAKAGGSVERTEDFPHADSRVSVARRTAKPVSHRNRDGPGEHDRARQYSIIWRACVLGPHQSWLRHRVA